LIGEPQNKIGFPGVTVKAGGVVCVSVITDDAAGQPVLSCPVTLIGPGVLTTIAEAPDCPLDQTKSVKVPTVEIVIGPLQRLSELGDVCSGMFTELARLTVQDAEVAAPQSVDTEA
jgi:hypothetical protein